MRKMKTSSSSNAIPAAARNESQRERGAIQHDTPARALTQCANTPAASISEDDMRELVPPHDRIATIPTTAFHTRRFANATASELTTADKKIAGPDNYSAPSIAPAHPPASVTYACGCSAKHCRNRYYKRHHSVLVACRYYFAGRPGSVSLADTSASRPARRVAPQTAGPAPSGRMIYVQPARRSSPVNAPKPSVQRPPCGTGCWLVKR